MAKIIDTELSNETFGKLLGARIECEDLDFKETIDVTTQRDVLEITKDIYAMANTSGGHIIIGVADNFDQVGLPNDFKLDEAVLRAKIERYIDTEIDLWCRELIWTCDDGNKKKFCFIYIKESTQPVLVSKPANLSQDNKQVPFFKPGEIYVRKGSSSQIISSSNQLTKFLNKFSKQLIEGGVSEIATKEGVVKLPSEGMPDVQDEQILSNIFPTTKIPEKIYYAKTDCRITGEVYEQLKPYFESEEHDSRDVASFILKNGNLYTFSDLERQDNPLCKVIKAGNVYSILTKTWFNEEDKERWLIELLNGTINRYCVSKALFFDKEYNRYFFPSRKEDKTITWQTPFRKAHRKVVRLCYDPKGVYCVHYAVRINFTKLGDSFYLLVDPCWIFTKDGAELLGRDRRGSLSSKFSWMDHNKKVLNNVFFWITYLSQGKTEVEMGKQEFQVNVDANPVSIDFPYGIKDDYSAITLLQEAAVEDSEDDLLKEDQDITKLYKNEPEESVELEDSEE